MKPLPPVEDRIRIIYWLLLWSKDQGKRIWCDEELIRVRDVDSLDTPRGMSWAKAQLIAAQQQRKLTGTKPRKRTSRGVLPKSTKSNRAAYGSVARSSHEHKEKE